jgi:hypothetical protein
MDSQEFWRGHKPAHIKEKYRRCQLTESYANARLLDECDAKKAF